MKYLVGCGMIITRITIAMVRSATFAVLAPMKVVGGRPWGDVGRMASVIALARYPQKIVVFLQKTLYAVTLLAAQIL